MPNGHLFLPFNTGILGGDLVCLMEEELRAGVQFKNIGFGQAAAWARVGSGGAPDLAN